MAQIEESGGGGKGKMGKGKKHAPNVDMTPMVDLAFLLEKLLERKVDVVTPEALSPHIGPHILREVERVPIAA